MATKDIELKTELVVFERHKLDWLRSNPGEFVVITGTRVAGFFTKLEKLETSTASMIRSSRIWARFIVWAIGRQMRNATAPGVR